ncbi:MAG TPA: hypothetical protein VF556_16785 [Pyrinomonadaceae bacterium]|jgi:hypothetical protein
MKRQLSSLLVPLYKLIFVFALANGIYWLFQDVHNLTQPGLYFIFGWCAVWYILTGCWKSVRLNGGFLQISNYLKTIEVPVSDVANVEGSSFWGWQPQTVKLTLKTASAFGNEIVFVPRGGWLNAKSFADELRQTLALR